MTLADFKDWLARKPAGPKPRKPLKRTRVRPVSKRRRKEGTEYSRKRKEFLATHPVCQATITARGHDLDKGCTEMATDVHHVSGRGMNYLNGATWLGVCRSCHRWIHEHPGKARRIGLLK